MKNSVEKTRSWGARIDPLRWLGPGFVLAATAIGASHLVLAPTAGASFGYALLWVMVASHVVKYPAFEFGPRFAIATGTSLLDGYARVPGPRGWALAVFLLGTTVQGVTVLAGVLGVAAAVAHLAVPALPIPAWSLILGLVVAAFLATGGFDALSALSKWMLLGLTLMTVFAFVSKPPGPGFLTGLVTPSIPPASVVLFAAVIGWMPTGVDVAVWHSMWALERRETWAVRGASKGVTGSPRRQALAVGQLDLRLGYGLSAVLAIMFVALGAEVLRPAGLDPMQGADVAIALARLYTESLGDWIFPIFMTAAFFGMFSTAYGVMDGFPRAFSEGVSRLVPKTAGSKKHLLWGFLFATLALAIAETLWIPNPVILVTIAAIVSFLIAPILFCLNHYCVTRLIDEPEMRPGRALRLWSGLGILAVTAASVFYLWVQLGPS